MMDEEKWIKESIEAVQRFVDGCDSLGDAADIAFLRGRLTLGDLRGVLTALGKGLPPSAAHDVKGEKNVG